MYAWIPTLSNSFRVHGIGPVSLKNAYLYIANVLQKAKALRMLMTNTSVDTNEYQRNLS